MAAVFPGGDRSVQWGATDRLGSVTVHNEDPIPEDPSDPGPPLATVATDAAGNVSGRTSARFRILRRRL